jgi:hypothetical protein
MWTQMAIPANGRDNLDVWPATETDLQRDLIEASGDPSVAEIRLD